MRDERRREKVSELAFSACFCCVWGAVGLIAVVGVLGGCAPSASRLRVRTGNAWADCYGRFEPGLDPQADLAELGEACAKPSGMSLVSTLRGRVQGPKDPRDEVVVDLRRGCYRAFAVGGAGVQDLSLGIYDADGDLTAADVSRGRWPVVPPRGPLCVERDERLTVTIAVSRGRGDYVLQLWGLPGATL